MLYPFTFTVDLHIQADSYEEAKKAAEAYLETDFLKEYMSMPQINKDCYEISSYSVDDVSGWDENDVPWDDCGCVIHRK